MTAISSRGEGGRLTLAGAAGTMAAVCSIGLLATSAWLISRASQHPPVLYLMIPVAAVQAFGIGRGVFRYAERLAGHDAACACWPGCGCPPTTSWSGLARVQARSAYARASGAAVSALAAGAALWGCLVLGVAGVRSGTMAGVTLAVLALMPLAVHEVFTGLAPAAQEIPRLRSAADRVADVLRHPDPVTEPVQPAPLPEAPYDITVRSLAARWAADQPDVLRGADLDLPAGSRVAVTGQSGAHRRPAGRHRRAYRAADHPPPRPGQGRRPGGQDHRGPPRAEPDEAARGVHRDRSAGLILTGVGGAGGVLDRTGVGGRGPAGRHGHRGYRR